MNNPYMIDWAITNRCNINCLHCRGMSEQELDGRIVLKTAEEIPSLRPRWVIIEGGEPLLRAELFEVLDILRASEIKVYLVSNGMLLEERATRRLADTGVSVMISIDGADRESYEKIRRGADFAKLKGAVAMAAAHQILDACPVTIGKHNHRQIGELFRFAKEIGYRKITFLGLKPCEDYTNYALSADEYEAAFFDIVQSQREEEMDVYVDEPFFKPFLKEHGIAYSVHAENGIIVPDVSRCIFGDYMFIEPNGDVKPCTFAPLVVGSVREKPLGEIWGEMQVSEFVRGIRDFSNRGSPCQQCQYLFECGGCRSRTYRLTQDWTASDPSCPLGGTQP